jgi:hypothetical protein
MTGGMHGAEGEEGGERGSRGGERGGRGHGELSAKQQSILSKLERTLKSRQL